MSSLDTPIQIIITDDHQMFIDGLKSVLSKDENIKIIGEASNGQSLLFLLQQKKPDILLLDINMPKMDGFEVMKIIQNSFQDIKVIVITTYTDYQLVLKLKKLGIKGFLVKTASSEELLESIKTVAEGKEYFHADILSILKQKQEEQSGYDNFIQRYKLTPREIEILKLVAQGYKTEDIARQVHLSTYTIEGYRKILLKKLSIKNVAGLTRFAYDNHLI